MRPVPGSTIASAATSLSLAWTCAAMAFSAARCAVRSRVVLITRPSRYRRRSRSARVCPKARLVAISFCTYRQKNGNSLSEHPPGSGRRLRASGVALAASALTCGIILSCAMRSSTRSRRSSSRLWCTSPRVGSVKYGVRTAPARVAAWAGVSAAAEVPKNRCAAACTPNAPPPK